MPERELNRQYQMLSFLVSRCDWQTLAQKCVKLLAHDPENFHLHQLLATAYVGLDWQGNVEPCLQALLRLGPNEASTHRFLVKYWSHRNKPDFAYWHAVRAMELDPEDAETSFIMGQALLSQGKIGLALQMLSRARSLAPDETFYGAIELQVRAIVQTSAEDAVKQKSDLNELLARDPNNALLLEMLGDFNADQLQNAKRAIELYKSALMCDPSNIECQQKLVSQIPKQNVFTQSLFLPLSAATSAFNTLCHGGWLVWIVWIIAFKGVLVFIAWLLITLPLFAIPALCFQLFFLAELSLLSFKSTPIQRIMVTLSKLPYWLRIVIVCFLILVYWASIMGVFRASVPLGLSIVGALYAFHLMIASFIILIKRVEFWHAELQAGTPLKTQLFRILLVLAACNLAMIFAFTISILMLPYEWIAMLVSAAIVVGGLLLNAFGILKILQFSLSAIRPTFQSTKLPQVGQPPPIPRALK